METHEPKNGRSPFIDMFLRVIAVLGLIAVLLLGAWGIIQLAVAIPTFFGAIGSGTSSLFTSNTQQESLAVATAATLNSGQTLQVAWTHTNADTSAQYSYAISYACESGLSLGAPVPTGSYQTVACNTPFDYVNATAHMTVIPVLSGTASAPLIITVTATKLSTGVITATGVSTTTVAPSAVATKPAATTPAKKTTVAKPSTTYYAASTRAALYGYPDLAVQILSATRSGMRTTVEFAIQNVGTNIVNSGWTFNATLPINGSYTFASQPQQALYPGDKIVYALTFDNVYGQNTYQQYPNYGYGYTGASSYTTGGYTCNGYNCTTPTNYNNTYPYNNNYYNNCTNNSCNNGYYNYNGQYTTGVVTITADPQSYIMEQNKGNNTASTVVPMY
jgi:hypothetical protein